MCFKKFRKPILINGNVKPAYVVFKDNKRYVLTKSQFDEFIHRGILPK